MGDKGGHRAQNEVTLAEGGMGDAKRRLMARRAPFSAAPQHNIEVQHPRSPAFPAPAPKLPLNGFKQAKHGRRRQICMHQHGAIGIKPQRRPQRRAANHRGHCLHRQSRRRQFAHRRPQHMRWPTMARVTYIRAKRDHIKVRCLGQGDHKAGACGRGKSPCQRDAWPPAPDRAWPPARRPRPRHRRPPDRPIHH